MATARSRRQHNSETTAADMSMGMAVGKPTTIEAAIAARG